MSSFKRMEIALCILFVLSTIEAFSMSSENNGTHTFGNRAESDRLIYRVNNSNTKEGFFFSVRNEVTEDGPDISYVEITIQQAFHQTHAYIASGGIGEKSIVVVLAVLSKAQSYSYEAVVYGA